MDLARGYLQQVGYNGFSFQTIADRLGIRKASVHHHFRSKEEMGIALLDEYVSAFRGWIERVALEPDARRRLRAYFAIFETFAADRAKICPLLVLSADFYTLPEGLKGKLVELHDVQRAWLVKTLGEAKDSGEISKEIRTTEAADAILSAIQGALALARVRGTEPLAQTRRFLFKSLENRRAGGRPPLIG